MYVGVGALVREAAGPLDEPLADLLRLTWLWGCMTERTRRACCTLSLPEELAWYMREVLGWGDSFRLDRRVGHSFGLTHTLNGPSSRRLCLKTEQAGD